MVVLQGLTKADLAEILLPLSRVKEGKDPRTQAKYRAKQIFHWVYQRYVTEWDQMSDLSKEVRAWAKENIQIASLSERTSQQSQDGTHKFLWNTHDNKTIESVIIPAALTSEEEKEQARERQQAYAGVESAADLKSDHWTRLTACISSQVGCAMACKFCLTGIQGLDRHLQAHEIVTQVLELRRRAPITNIVFMGMGEPLHNLENTIKAIKILLDDDGMNFSKRKITVSTSGIAPAIVELGKETDVQLAVSLNASEDKTRSEIMPVNKKWPIAELLKAVRQYPLSQHRRVTFEYVLLASVNDSMDDAKRLVPLLRGISCKINLIPFNVHSGTEFNRTPDVRVKEFQHYLLNQGFTTTVRISRGRDILAACGQLRSIFGTAKGTEKHKDWKDAPPASQIPLAQTSNPPLN
ncbi:MAG: 23S rRNA (adenine(2503)-C(2))-methyltransferase RlmN [Xanthomonadaceae bacterium]|nr:23S rRNA (adenine(2503)-C(2))-methyltransferase RlmN [Xanthomonadaceae bacterium]